MNPANEVCEREVLLLRQEPATHIDLINNKYSERKPYFYSRSYGNVLANIFCTFYRSLQELSYCTFRKVSLADAKSSSALFGFHLYIIKDVSEESSVSIFSFKQRKKECRLVNSYQPSVGACAFTECS